MLQLGLAVALSLGPGVYAYLTSRKLLSRADDPLLPDLLLARTQRLTIALAIAAAVGISLPLPLHFSVSVILGAGLATLAGAFPARRTVFGESWSLVGYLGHTIRFWLAMLGSLLLVMLIPLGWELGGLALGLVVGGLALLYSTFLPQLFPAILRASPLDRPELDEPFRAVLAKARCPVPRLFEADAPGGTFVNAFALPSLWTPGVLFTSGLLRAFDTREATAVFAHEVAHLEHHDRRHMLKALLSMVVLVALPVVLLAGPYASAFGRYVWFWPLIVILAFVLKARAHRAHESESDLRGVELCGDPEALISGLTKLHALMRLPRRWSEQHESLSTHPSLSRRIQAIRRSYASEAQPLEPAAFFVADESRRAVVLDSERVHLLSGIDAAAAGDPLVTAEERRSIAYSALRDLRLEATEKKNELVVVESGGRTTRLRVTEDASRLSELLDRIDGQLAYRAAPSSAGGRIASLVVAILGLSALSLPVAILGGLAAALPSITTLASAGIGGLAASVFAWARLGTRAFDAAFLAAASLVCLGIAWRRRRRRRDPHPNGDEPRRARMLGTLVPAFLALLGIGWAMTGLSSPLPLMALHLWARDAVGTAASLAACSAALLSTRRPRARFSSVLTALGFVLVTSLGTVDFGRRFGGDVFAEIPSPASESTTTMVATRSVSLPGSIVELSLSPEGKHFVARVDTDEGYDEPGGRATYLVETETGVETIEALAVDWVDDATLARVELQGNDKVLRLPGRRLALPPVVPLRLEVEPASASWWIRGYHSESYDTVVLHGSLDSERFETLVLSLPDGEGATFDAVSLDGWALSYDYVFPEMPPMLQSFGLSTLAQRPFATELSLRRRDSDPVRLGLSLLDPSCYDTGSSKPTFLCVASNGRSTNLFAVEPGKRGVEPFASVDGEHYVNEPIRRGRFLLTRWYASPFLVDLEQGRFVRLPDSPDNDVSWEIVAWRGPTLANAARTSEGTTEVTLYRLEADALMQ